MEIIKCSKCHHDTKITDFTVRNGKRNKQCNKCRKYFNEFWKHNKNNYVEKRKKYYRDNKERHQFRNFRNTIKQKYGITPEKYEEMLKAQNNQCAICKVDFVLDGSKSNLNKLPCIDHSHQTNKVRALLCRKCNVSLGHIETGFYEKAKEYLRVYDV